MSGPTADEPTGGESGPDEPYYVPRRLTEDGEHAFRREICGFAARLAEQMQLNAELAGRAKPEFTAHDVEYATSTVQRARGDTTGWAVIATVLVTLGSVGSAVMTPHLHSDWQIVLFGLFALAGSVGLVLTWTSRPRRPVRASAAAPRR